MKGTHTFLSFNYEGYSYVFMACGHRWNIIRVITKIFWFSSLLTIVCVFFLLISERSFKKFKHFV